MLRPALSLVVPAYNESARLDRFFAAVDEWLSSPPCRPAELVLVDDGSEDDTLPRLRAYARSHEGTVRVLANDHRGKGFAVRAGMLEARGELVLFSDLDLSCPLDEAPGLIEELDRGADVVIASREIDGARRGDEPLARHLLGRGFNLLVRILLVPGIRDSQCGFKMFRHTAAQEVFRRLRRYGPDAPPVRGPMVTAFDVEVLFVARKLGLRTAEVPVHWTYAAESKVRPGTDAFRMARDVVMVKIGDLRGQYDAGVS